MVVPFTEIGNNGERIEVCVCVHVYMCMCKHKSYMNTAFEMPGRFPSGSVT